MKWPKLTLTSQPPRSGITVSIVLGNVVLLGLASRRFPSLFPAGLRDYPGDAFWAMAAYGGVILIWPGIAVSAAAVVASAIALAVELSQLYHAEWIDAIRRTVFGRLVLGSGFDWYDLLAYSMGVLLAAIMDRCIFKRTHRITERIKK